MFKKFLVAAATSTFSAGLATAAPLSGLFNVTAYNVTNLNSTESRATLANFTAASSSGYGGANSVWSSDTFQYTGALDFRVGQPQTAAYTIGDWFEFAASGSASGLDVGFADLQLSFPSISNGTATTTFFMFELVGQISAGEFDVTHDDGMQILDDGVVLPGGNVGPTAERNSNGIMFDGGYFSLLYVATNGNPSILEVDVVNGATPVPVPASAILLFGALGGLAAMRRRRKAA